MDYRIYFIEAKYHLSVAKRLLKNYDSYSEKRLLIGAIRESAKSASKIIKAFMIYQKVGGGEVVFFKKLAPKYLDKITRTNLAKIIEVEKAQANSPIEFRKKENIILLIDGEYRFITVNRIKEFTKSVDNTLSVFSANFRQI